MPMRAPKSEPPAESAVHRVMAQFNDLGWAPTENKSHDLGTDIFLRSGIGDSIWEPWWERKLTAALRTSVALRATTHGTAATSQDREGLAIQPERSRGAPR
jgi:hypothetical protein